MVIEYALTRTRCQRRPRLASTGPGHTVTFTKLIAYSGLDLRQQANEHGRRSRIAAELFCEKRWPIENSEQGTSASPAVPPTDHRRGQRLRRRHRAAGRRHPARAGAGHHRINRVADHHGNLQRNGAALDVREGILTATPVVRRDAHAAVEVAGLAAGSGVAPVSADILIWADPG